MNSFSILFAATALTFTLGACSNAPTNANNTATDTDRATLMAGGAEYAVLDFDKGSDNLTAASREKLQQLTALSTRDGRKVDEIKVLAWADREYPATGSKADRNDIALADDRAKSVKNFLTDDLKAKGDVDTHNMAERPGVWSEMVKSDDYKLKSVFERTGAAPTAANGNESQLIGSKVSKAVVLVKYE